MCNWSAVAHYQENTKFILGGTHDTHGSAQSSLSYFNSYFYSISEKPR